VSELSSAVVEFANGQLRESQEAVSVWQKLLLEGMNASAVELSESAVRVRALGPLPVPDDDDDVVVVDVGDVEGEAAAVAADVGVDV